MPMKVKFNAPVVLTLAIVSFAVLLADRFLGSRLIPAFFAVYPSFDPGSAPDYFRLFSHVFGHASWLHLSSNFMIILLVGPMLEEKYGSKNLFTLMVITALVTSVVNIIFFNNGLMGSSGIAFMMIMMSSFTNYRKGEIPLTFILVAAIFLSGEVANAFKTDNIAQFAHFLGGGCGSVFCLLKKA